MSSVSIIIPTLSPSEILKEYVSRLATFRHIQEVIVVVNGNGKDYVENNTQWRFLGKNTGFTGACNAGAHMARGVLLLFLNDDCELFEDALTKMVQFVDEHTEIVATQPIIYQKEHKQKNREIENVGFWVDIKIGKANPVRSVEEFSKTQHLAQSGKRCIYGLSATCLLIKNEVFEKVGAFDKTFHSYLEDVDLAIRLHKAGYIVGPCLNASVMHEHMATSSKMGLYKNVQDVKNWWRLILKHPDVFAHWNAFIPLFIERGRNMSGLLKAAFHLPKQP